MPTALQKQLDALLADFTARLVQLVREASLEDLVARGAVVVRDPRPTAPMSKPEPRRAVAAPEPPRRRAAPLKPEAIEDSLLRQLRSGVLLTLDELVAFGPSERETRSAIDRLAARGLIGFSGAEPDRFVFAQSGPPRPVAVPAPVVAMPTVARPVVEEPTPAPPVSTVTPSAANGADGSHPFVVRRKKAAAT